MIICLATLNQLDLLCLIGILQGFSTLTDLNIYIVFRIVQLRKEVQWLGRAGRLDIIAAESVPSTLLSLVVNHDLQSFVALITYLDRLEEEGWVILDGHKLIG